MRVERLDATGAPADAARRARALVPGGESIRGAAQEIVDAVRREGDAALRRFAEGFDGLRDRALRVDASELDAAAAGLRSDVRAGLEVAMANVAAVMGASLGDDAELRLPQGQHVLVRELPVRRAAIYVPGGRAPYPSTVVMGVVTAQVAGVEEIAVCAPGGHDVVLAACALCGVDEVYRVGGAHGVAALAYGTPTVPRVDVVAGPGSLWVQEAKRLVSGDVGIDAFLGPSDVLVVADRAADAELVALDLMAQAEHGEGTVVVAASPDAGLLDAVADRLAGAAETGAVAALVGVVDLEEALRFAEAFAPEHLELVGVGAERLAGRVRSAGCVFVGATAATAFGDYVAGSNHSLPTGGAARFASGLTPRVFRRRMSVVRIDGAADRLARPGAAIARAEGYELHARSMEARMGDNARR